MGRSPAKGRGSQADAESPTVLIVEDDADLAELYAVWIQEPYHTRVAHDGDQALDVLDEHVDIVLLDRRMPGLSGDEVLAEIRDREIDCHVAMVSAVAPDFDVVDMEFDDYLAKPVSKDDLHETIDELLARADYHEQVQDYCSLATRCAALETEKSEVALDASDRYAELQEELADKRERLAEESVDVTPYHDFEGLFRDPEDDTGTSGGKRP